MAHQSALERAWVDFQAFFKTWGISKEEIAKVIEVPNEVYESWVQSGAMSLSPRIVLRCAECWILNEVLLGILHKDQVHIWMNGPVSAPPCAGRSPIQTMCEELEKNPRIIRDITAYAKRHRQVL